MYWNDDIWISTHAVLQSGGTDVYLGGVQHSNPLSAGATSTSSVLVKLPANLAPGSYYFIIAADRPTTPPGFQNHIGENVVFESNETNNYGATSAAKTVTAGTTPKGTTWTAQELRERWGEISK